VTGVSNPFLEGAPAATVGHEPVLAVLDLMPDAILALDASGGTVPCRRTASSVFGLGTEQAAGLTVGELVPALARDGIAKAMADAIVVGGGRIRIARLQTDGMRRGGTPFPLEASIAESHAVAGARRTCAARDLTEQHLAEATLSLFSQAVDSSASGIVITSARLPGHPITYVNPAFTRITGYASHEAVGRNCGFLPGPDDDQPEIAVLRAAMRDGRAATVMLRNHRRDGSPLRNDLHIAPVRDPYGAVRHCLGVQTDVTARVEAERELAMRNTRLDAVMSLSLDGFVLFDASDRLVHVNEALTAMLAEEGAGLAGLTREAFEARLAAACAPADGGVPDAPRSAPESGQRMLELVQPQRRVLQCTECTERTHAGHGGETVRCFLDVTRETEIDRMKSEFLTTAAHELRTPLASAFGYAELLIARELDAPKRQRMLQTIHAQAKPLTSMIDDLLDLAKIEARRGGEAVLYPVPLGMPVDGALEGPAAGEAPRELEVDVGARSVEVAVDPDRTRQAITSVLSNACRQSAPGSPARLAVRTVAGPDGPTVVVVTDRGICMSAEQCARAFERFYRADPPGHIPGTGLGLSIAKEGGAGR
jgi:PAS domain S-box-containing protein